MCDATRPALAGTHAHTCTGNHEAGIHWCPTCKRWWN